DGVGERQLDLAVVAARAEDAQVGDDPLPRADQRHRLLCREEAVLIKRLHRRQFVALAEESLQVFLRGVAVARRDVDDELWFGGLSRGAHATLLANNAVAVGSLTQRLAHQALHQGAVQHGGAHFFSSSARATRTRTSVWSSRRRCSSLSPSSTINVSIVARSHRKARAGRPIFVWSATTTTSSAQRIICRSVSTSSRLLLYSPRGVMPPTLMTSWWTCRSSIMRTAKGPRATPVLG